MSPKPVRRELIETARELVQLYREVKDNVTEIEHEFDFLQDFFVDYETSYSLSLAYPESLWKATAEQLGIDTEGKDRLQLAKEVMAKSAEMKLKEAPEKPSLKD